jgi:hypothetical protein
MSGASSAKAVNPDDFTALLRSLVAETKGENVTLGQLLSVVGRRSFGPVILLLGVIAVSPLTVVPGASWIVAAATLLFAAQLVVGQVHPWLPRRILKIEFQREHLEKTVKGGMFAAHVADQITSPRLTFLSEPPFVNIVALLCVAAALITFPLGLLPLGPLLPGLAIALIGVGLTARDGVFLIFAAVLFAASGYILWTLLPKIMPLVGSLLP